MVLNSPSFLPFMSIAGDLHGQYIDIFERGGFPPAAKYGTMSIVASEA